MRFSRTDHAMPPVRLQMTPMIDIVFLLLTFFVMTFKIVAPEGDFSVRIPQQGNAAASVVPPTEVVRVRLIAGNDGTLTNIVVADRNLGADIAALRRLAVELVGDSDHADITAELDPDPGLRYEFTIAAMTALAGEVRGGRIHRLIEKVSLRAASEE